MASAIAPVPQQPTPQQMMQAQMLYGPNAGLAAQRSQYLAQALQAMQANTDNIRTPAALWTHLLADGLTQWSKNDADKQFMTAYQGDQATQLANLTKGLPDGSTPGGGFVSADTLPKADPNAPIDPGMSVPPQAAATANAIAPPAQVDPQTLALARMVYGEARGEPAAGQQAVAAVALNRAHKLGVPVDQVVAAPHQFSGYNPQTQNLPADKLAAVLGNIQGVADGSVPDPTGGADHFFNPSLAQPSWGQGPGQMIGQHKFMSLGEPGQMPPQQAQSAPAPGAPQPPAQPYQVASNGATPPPPQVGNAAPAPPVGPTPAAAPSSAAGVPMQPAQPPHQLVTPEQVALAKQYYNDPRTHQQGVEMLMQLQQRMVSQPELKPGTYWGQDGQAHSVEQFVDQPGSPNAFTQRSSLDNSVHTQANPAYGSLPAGTSMSQSGQISQVPIQQQQTFKIPNVNGVFVNGPDGRPVKVGDDQYGPEQLFSLRKQVLDSDAFKNFQSANDAWGAMVAAAKQPNGGMRAYALRDTFARLINPGAVARVGTIEAIKQSQGIPAEIKAFLMNLQGDGNVPPEVAQQIMDVSQGFLASHYAGAKALNDSNTAYAQRHGVDPADVTAPLPPPPERFVIPQNRAAPAAAAGGHIDGASPATAFHPTTEAEFEHLPVGAWFINPADQKPMRKAR